LASREEAWRKPAAGFLQVAPPPVEEVVQPPIEDDRDACEKATASS